MRGAGTPIWDDLASEDDLAALAPPRPQRIPAKPDVLVVGGGAIGLAIAASCTRAAMDVVLVEREQRLATGPSGRAAGALSPDAHPTYGSDWGILARRSLELHRELARETGFRAVDLRLLPDLVIPKQGHVDPLKFCAALARRAGTVVVGATRDELHVDPKVVVYATGDAGDVAGQSHVRGHLIATAPVAPVIEGTVHSPPDDVLMLQLPSGHIVAGGTKDIGETQGDVDDAIAQRICDVATKTCGEIEITHRWTCFRPLIPGELPKIGLVARNTWVAGGFFSTGILMAPAVGELIARELS